MECGNGNADEVPAPPTSVAKTTKTVSFFPTVQIRLVPLGTKDSQRSDLKKRWYSRDELDEIKKELIEVAHRIRSLEHSPRSTSHPQYSQQQGNSTEASDTTNIDANVASSCNTEDDEAYCKLDGVDRGEEEGVWNNHDDDHEDYCIRGIEHLKSEAHCDQRGMIMDSVICAVLHEQNLQRREGIYNPQELCEASQFCSQWGKDKALETAANDAEYVRRRQKAEEEDDDEEELLSASISTRPQKHQLSMTNTQDEPRSLFFEQPQAPLNGQSETRARSWTDGGAALVALSQRNDDADMEDEEASVKFSRDDMALHRSKRKMDNLETVMQSIMTKSLKSIAEERLIQRQQHGKQQKERKHSLTKTTNTFAVQKSSNIVSSAAA